MRAHPRSEIERDILGYLVEHADAEDTLEGVAEWWLLQQSDSAQDCRMWPRRWRIWSLAGLLIERTRPGARPHYRINRRRRGHIARLVGADRPLGQIRS